MYFYNLQFMLMLKVTGIILVLVIVTKTNQTLYSVSFRDVVIGKMPKTMHGP